VIRKLIEWWKKGAPPKGAFTIRKGGFNVVGPLGAKRPPPPKGQGLPSRSQMELTIKGDN